MAELRYLKDADGNIIYPVTHTDAIIGDINNNEYQTVTDTNLSTGNKTVVGAINEIYQNVNNGKQLIASAIGNPLITNKSTFETMSEAILGLRRNTDNEADVRETLYNMMIEDGYNNATSEMTVDELIQLLDDSQINISEIKQIACGEDHTVVLKSDGTVWVCGFNDAGELGLGDNNSRKTFTQVTGMNDVEQISCGAYHTVILKNNGSVWATGHNGNGELGLNDNNDRNTFTQITDMNNVKQIACGFYHTVILKNNGSVWSCGYNGKGQLGLGNTNTRAVFAQVTTNVNNDVKQIACGYYYTFILKSDGSIWSCGHNEYGQLGLGNNDNQTTFTKVVTGVNNDVKQISCGEYHTFIIRNSGSVWACGSNESRQLGISAGSDQNTFTQATTNVSNVKEIVCGCSHTVMLKNDGSVWSCGNSYFGQLGLNNISDATSFTQVTTNINNDVKQIASGGYFTFILKNDGSLWSCGYNNSGQLGLGNNDNKNVFTQVSLSSQAIDEYEMNRQKLYYYLLDNEMSVTEDMDINTMLNLLVDDYVNNAIVGHENNLRIILANEGVEVSEEDDMNDLITKVDEEFDRQVVPDGTAVASDVLASKTFINSTGNLVTGSITNQGSKTITPKSTKQTLNAGYYSGITINGNANLKAANIVEGVTIFGVTGTAKTGGYYFNSDSTGVAEVTLHQDNGQQTYSAYGVWSTIISVYTSKIEGRVKFAVQASSGNATVRVKKISGSTTTYPTQTTISGGSQAIYSLTVDITVGDKIQLEVNPSSGYPFYKYGVTLVTNVCS